MGHKNDRSGCHSWLNGFALALACSLLIVGFGCATDDSSSAPSQAEFEQFLTDVAAEKNAALMSGDIAEYASYFAASAFPAAEPQLNEYDPSVLAHIRERMMGQGTDIVSVTSTVTVLRVTQDRDDFSVRYTLHTTLHYSLGGQTMSQPAEDITELRAILRRDGATLVVRELRLDNGAAEEPGADQALEVPGPLDFGIEPGVAGEIASLSQVVPFTYYWSAAAAYADRYALSYNPAYRAFSADCTNFVSQSLRAGGRSYISGWYWTDGAWWYNTTVTPLTPGQSYSWAGARNLFANMIASYGGSSVATISVRSGDLVFADWQPDGVIDHAMIVSRRACSTDSWSCILIDQHVTNRYQWPLSLTLASEPRARLYPVRPSF